MQSSKQSQQHLLLSLFRPIPVGITLLLIAIHQSMIASSSYFLIELITAFQTQHNYDFYLYAYLFTMVIPYIPGCFAHISLQYWINQAHHQIVGRLMHSALNQTHLYRDSKRQEMLEATVSRNSFSICSAYLSFIYGFVDFLLNSVLSILVLGLILPGHLLTGYMVSLILCALAIIILRPSIAKLADNSERLYIHFSTALSTIWENVVLGNQHNFHYWQEDQRTKGNAYYHSVIRLEWVRELSNILLSMLSLGPTIFLVISAIYTQDTGASFIAAIIVNLTRIFHILNALSTLVYDVLDWSSIHARLGIISETDNMMSEPYSTLPMQVYKPIQANGRDISNFDVFQKTLLDIDYGRFTITGENGSGKTTLLYFLKKNFADKAFFIPAHYANLCWGKDIHHLSSGEKMLYQLNEILHIKGVHYLLLDEWDANLDQSNRAAIDQFLTSLSKQYVIIEVRHLQHLVNH